MCSRRTLQNQARMSTDFRCSCRASHDDRDYSVAMTEETNFPKYKLKPWPICVIAKVKFMLFFSEIKSSPYNLTNRCTRYAAGHPVPMAGYLPFSCWFTICCVRLVWLCVCVCVYLHTPTLHRTTFYRDSFNDLICLVATSGDINASENVPLFIC